MVFRLISGRILIFLAIIIAGFWLIGEYPDESVLIISLCAILIIGIWLYQAYANEPL